MLSKENAEMLGKVLPKGITVDVLTQAITSNEEVNIDLPKGRFLTNDDEAILIDNHGKTKYDEGKRVGTEVTLKDLSKKTGFETAFKDSDTFIDAFKQNILKDIKAEPNKKITELQSSLTELQGKYEADLKAEQEKTKSYQSEINGIITENALTKALPNLIDGITSDVAITMFKSNFEVKEDGVYQNGNLLKNDLQAPISKEDALIGFLTEKNWIKKTPRGNGSKGSEYSGSSPKNYEEFEKYCESKGINPASEEGRKKSQEFAKDNPNFLD